LLSRRTFLKISSITAASLTSAVIFNHCSSEKRPNFLFLLVDDLGWTDLGCFGSTFYETLNIDKLASQGMRFSQAYAACPVCSPTRASIMTGKYPARMNTTDWFGAPQPYNVQNHWTRNKPLLPAEYLEQLPLEEKTMAETFKENGYRTFFAGKWHLGPEGFWPEDQGFEINKGGWSRGGPYGPGIYFTPYGNPRLEDGPVGEHLPDRLATETVKFIAQNSEKPFLAFLSFYSVHTPLVGRPDLVEKYKAKSKSVTFKGKKWLTEGEQKVRQVQDHPVYGAMVEAMDLAVGKVLDKLEQLNLSDNTVIIFTSDNGGLSTSEGHPTSNLPLRAGKGWLYEGGIREPLIIKFPGVTQAGSICDEVVTSTDFYPTMLEMAGMPLQQNQHLDGISLMSLLDQSGTPERDAIYWHYPHYGNQGSSPGAAIRSGDWKLIEYFEDNRAELYNIKNDIGERNNLADSNTEKVHELKEKLHKWQQEVDAKFPAQNPAFSADG